MAEQIYHEQTRTQKIINRLFIILTLCSCILALVFCGIKSAGNPNVNFLTANLVISSLVALVIVFWYYNGTISSEKSWYLWLICFCFLFQSITIDIFVWHHAPKSNATVHPTTHVMPTTGGHSTHSSHHGTGQVTGGTHGTGTLPTGTAAAGTHATSH